LAGSAGHMRRAAPPRRIDRAHRRASRSAYRLGWTAEIKSLDSLLTS